MAYKSWLEKVKRIEDLGPHCHNLAGSLKEEDWAREEEKDRKFVNMARQPAPVETQYQDYFGSKLHSSYLLDIKREKTTLTATVDMYAGSCFRFELAALLGVEEPDVLFKLDLICHGVEYFASRAVLDDGSLTWKDWKSVAEQDSLRWEFFHQQDGRLQWIVHFWTPTRDQKRSSDQYLLIDCSHVSAVDHSNQAVRQAFGDRYHPLWLAFKECINDPNKKDLLRSGEANSFLIEQADALGIPFDLPTG